jgi:hypothetical protein
MTHTDCDRFREHRVLLTLPFSVQRTVFRAIGQWALFKLFLEWRMLYAAGSILILTSGDLKKEAVKHVRSDSDVLGYCRTEPRPRNTTPPRHAGSHVCLCCQVEDISQEEGYSVGVASGGVGARRSGRGGRSDRSGVPEVIGASLQHCMSTDREIHRRFTELAFATANTATLTTNIVEFTKTVLFLHFFSQWGATTLNAETLPTLMLALIL